MTDIDTSAEAIARLIPCRQLIELSCGIANPDVYCKECALCDNCEALRAVTEERDDLLKQLEATIDELTDYHDD